MTRPTHPPSYAPDFALDVIITPPDESDPLVPHEVIKWEVSRTHPSAPPPLLVLTPPSP